MDTYPHLTNEPQTEPDWFEALTNLARFLRTPEGCPWDREQSAHDFAQYAVGETEEYVEALAKPEPNRKDQEHTAEEFGDALFTLLASAAAAEEEGRFAIQDALQAAHQKMIRRHDHVFGETKATTPEEAEQAWEKAKAKEKAGES